MSIFNAWVIMAPVVAVPALMVGSATGKFGFTIIGYAVVFTQAIALLITRKTL